MFMKGKLLTMVQGRQWAFNLTVLFSSVFGLALAGSQNYETFLVLTAFVGFGVGGNIPIDTTITLEFIPQVSDPKSNLAKKTTSDAVRRDIAVFFPSSLSSSRSASFSRPHLHTV